MKHFLLVLSICLAGVVFGQKDFSDDEHFADYIQKHLVKSKKRKSDYSSFLKGKHCRAELRMLRRVIEEGQPQLYKYTSREQIDEAFTNLYKKCRMRIDYLEYVKGIAKIQNTIRAGHSGWQHSPTYIRHAKESELYFPFDIRYDGDSCKIYHNFSQYSRTEIEEDMIFISINGTPIDSIIDEIRRYTDLDGKSNDESHRNIMESFRFLYSDFIGKPDVFRIECFFPEAPEKIKTLEVNALSLADISKNRKSRYQHMIQKKEVLSTNHFENKAYLGLQTFSSDKFKKHQYDYRDNVKNFFEKVEEYGSDELYIDLRGNLGGQIMNASYLLSFLIKDTVDYISTEIKKVKDFVYEPLLQKWVEYPEWISVDTIDSKYFIFEQPKVTPASSYNYSGSLYVIIDSQTQSCASSICSILELCHPEVTFIGEETGSPRIGSGGNTATILLPYSKIKYSFPQAWNRTLVVNNDTDHHGVIPDIPIYRKPMKFYDWDFYMDIVDTYNSKSDTTEPR